MGKEIERKFLVKNDDWIKKGVPVLYIQGYLSINRDAIVRIRTIDDKGFLTIKSSVVGISRYEFEYEIPFDEASFMLETLCKKPLLKKERTKILYNNFLWEVDRFLEENKGLVIAEVELEKEEQNPELPSWIGEEVTGDPKYYNSNLINNPYSEFSNKS